ncbi:MAG: hypothetical protein Q4D81_04120 [Eubacteriales bacterium]|nr:hypothetical protein [Eubacteriales bacterium]
MRWTRKKTADILRQFSVLLKREEDGNGLETIAFSHKYIADWLCNRDAGVWQADPADGAAAMAEAFFEICREDAEDLSDFEALQLRFFLEKSGRKKELRALKGNVRLLRRLLETGLRCAYAEEHEKALRYLREAAVWGEEVLERNPEELDTDPGLEEALRLTGEIYRELGIELEDYGNAENLEKALKCCEKFRQAAFSLYSWKKNEAYTLMYASALGQTGDAYRRYGTKECLRKAIVWFQKREAMILPLLRDHPTAKVRGAVVSVSHQLLKTYMELGEEENLKKALQYAEICIQQTESLNEPETADSLCDRGYAFLWMGGVQLSRKKTGANTLPAAGQAFESAVRNFEKADRMEHSMKNSRALAQGLFRLGEVYTEIGTPEKRRAAVEVYVKCREIGNALWEQNPTPDRLRELALAWRALGTAWQRLDEEEALEHARSCLEQGLQCSLRLTSWVDTIQYRRDLAISYGRLGEIMERTAVCKADLEASLAQHETCLEILRSIPAKRHTGPVLFETAACEERIGDFLVRHSAGEEGERKEEHDGEGVARNAADHYRSALTLLKDSDLPQKPEMTGRIQKKLTEITDRTDGTTARA